MFGWLKSNRQRALIRNDRKHLEARARRLLKGYLAADAPRKQRYIEVVAEAADACQASISNLNSEQAQISDTTAQAALEVMKQREQQAIADNDQIATMIIDAYATVAIASRRASSAYSIDEDMQKLGTAAVHLVTNANSYVSALRSSGAIGTLASE